MTNLSELLPSGGGAKEFSVVASGALTTGQTVALTSAGTVEAIGDSAASLSSEVQFAPVAGTNVYTFISGHYDPDNNVVVFVYNGTADYLTAVVGTISGTTITWGTEVITTSYATSYPSLAYSTADDVFVVTFDGASVIAAKRFTISGTTLTWQSDIQTITNASGVSMAMLSYVPDSDRFLAVYQTATGPVNMLHSIGQISGSATSWTAYTSFNGANIYSYDPGYGPSLSYDPTYGQVLVATTGYTNSIYAMSVTMVDVPASGSATISQAQTALDTYYGTRPVLTYNEETKEHLLAYAIVSSTTNVLPITVTSASTFSYPSIAQNNFNTITGNNNVDTFLGGGYNALIKQVCLIYREEPSFSEEMFVVNLDTTTSPYSVGTSILVSADDDDAQPYRLPIVYNSNSENMAVGFREISSPYKGQSVVFTPDSNNGTSFIGITSEAIADTATGKVNPQGGVGTAQSTVAAGLTTGSTFGGTAGTALGDANYTKFVYDPSTDRTLCTWTGGTSPVVGYAVGVVGKLTAGTTNTISWGTERIYNTATNYAQGAALLSYDPNSSRCYQAIYNSSPPNDGYFHVFEITADASNGTFSYLLSSSYDTVGSAPVAYASDDTAILLAYFDQSSASPYRSYCRTMTISANNTVAFGNKLEITGGYGYYQMTVAYDSNVQRWLMAGSYGSQTGFDTRVVILTGGEVSGYGAVTTIQATNPTTGSLESLYDPSSQRIAVSYKAPTGSNYNVIVATVTGGSTNTIAIGGVTAWCPSAGTAYYRNQMVLNTSTNEITWVISKYDTINSLGDIGFITVGKINAATSLVTGITDTQLTTLGGSSAGKVSGYVALTYDSTANRILANFRLDSGGYPQPIYYTVQFPSSLVALTPDSVYYVQTDGSLTTTSSTVTAGKAISTTQLVLKGAS